MLYTFIYYEHTIRLGEGGGSRQYAAATYGSFGDLGSLSLSVAVSYILILIKIKDFRQKVGHTDMVI